MNIGDNDSAFENFLTDEPVVAPVVDPVATADPSTTDAPVVDPVVANPTAAPVVEIPEFDENAVDNSWMEAPAAPAPVEYPEDFNKSVEERFGKLGIKSGTDLELFMSQAHQVNQRLQEAEAKLLEATKTPLTGLTDYQKKILEFTKDYDGTNGSVVAEFERLQSLDVTKLTDKEKIKEAFLFDNRKFGKEKASKYFEIEYKKKYDISSLDPEIDAEAIEERTLTLERDAYNANEKLVEAIKTFKPEAPQPPQTVDNTKLMEAVKQTSAQVDVDLKEFKVLTLRMDQDSTYNLGLREDMVSKVAQEVKAHFSNPANYDDSGREVNGYTPKSMAELMTKVMYFDEIMFAYGKRAVHLSEMRKIKDKQPQAQRPLSAAAGSTEKVAKNSDEAFDNYLES